MIHTHSYMIYIVNNIIRQNVIYISSNIFETMIKIRYWVDIEKTC